MNKGVKQNEIVDVASPDTVVQSIRRRRDKLSEEHHHLGTPIESTRRAEYQGHSIVIRTSYEIEVDGVPVGGHVAVSNDGDVHYHAVPNLTFASATKLVEALIDAFPDDFDGNEPM